MGTAMGPLDVRSESLPFAALVSAVAPNCCQGMRLAGAVQRATMDGARTMGLMTKFNADERQVLLAVKGVGPTVITRLEDLGIGNLEDLARRDPDQICAEVSKAMGATCWRNSPQARFAIAAAVARARQAF